MIQTQPDFRIEEIDPLHPDAVLLLQAAAREIRPLYSGAQDPNTSLPTNEPAVPRSIYLLARVNGRPIGSAALRPLDKGTAELRRVYVIPEFRGQGVARELLRSIEDAAMKFGYTAIRLETGNQQAPAIALYEACGYRSIPPFGAYADDPTSVCFEKMLSL